MLNTWRKSADRRRLSDQLCAALIARSRAPVFFRDLGVPDTIDGRFDLLALHAWLVLERLEAIDQRDVAQAVTDALFVGFDEGLRDLGAGDMGMSRRMKKLAQAFYGRMQAYSAAADDAELAAAIARNVYRGADAGGAARTLALYAKLARVHLCSADIARGIVEFGPLPGTEDGAA
ncbi:MAG TPA: ubiquinol-cytochrome C chaperone family protein [Rhizomicrobium sp.]|nr:ubiquinol-cytochrome C chaperone family protein [Rhizomicrobium sp.]